MDLNYLLSTEGIDTSKSAVRVMRHVPTEPPLKRALPWLAAERPAAFNMYQQFQFPSEERQLMQADYLASFIGMKPGEALFVGLYAVKAHRKVSFAQYWKLPANLELKKLGMTGWASAEDRPFSLLFDLELTDVFQEWKGKLIVSWSGERSWARWAKPVVYPVKAILEESALEKGMPRWNELFLTWEELRHLPKSWVGALSQWRGVYFILDAADGRGYVGSAYGDANLYARWMNYAAKGDGGNKRLRERKPDKFLFSIIELVSPAMSPQDVIQLESGWKDRLHTREFGLNAN